MQKNYKYIFLFASIVYYKIFLHSKADHNF